ncbi:MAG TPA: fructosamine kinase family protein [Solirubrobacteraceae bacterium]
MTVPAALAAAVARAAGVEVTGGSRASGGSINEAWALELAGGGRAFLKTRADAAPGEYATEAAGLRWLAQADALALPAVLAVGDGDGPRFLALEWVDAGRLDAAGEEELGRGLAALHAAGAPDFGAPPPGAPAPGSARELTVDGPGADPADLAHAAPADAPRAPLRIGELSLPNDPAPDWPAFYAQRRLEPLVALCLERRTLSASGARAVGLVCERIGDLAGPAEPPARLHGDLWGGNVLAGADGRARLIDPAAYGGHREVDLAMLRLFGAPSERVFAAYAEVAPLADGHRERVELWQLFPLLVHAALFGGSYGASVERAAVRYVT